VDRRFKYSHPKCAAFTKISVKAKKIGISEKLTSYSENNLFSLYIRHSDILLFSSQNHNYFVKNSINSETFRI
jgi:hypothetical protein